MLTFEIQTIFVKCLTRFKFLLSNKLLNQKMWFISSFSGKICKKLTLVFKVIKAGTPGLDLDWRICLKAGDVSVELMLQ